MTKTSVDVYMLFTCFVDFNNDYEGLFNICNTDTYLYCFFILKKKIYSSAGCKFCFHLTINMIILWISCLISAVEPDPNEQKDLKTM